MQEGHCPCVETPLLHAWPPRDERRSPQCCPESGAMPPPATTCATLGGVLRGPCAMTLYTMWQVGPGGGSTVRS